MQNMLITNAAIVAGGIPAVIDWNERYAKKKKKSKKPWDKKDPDGGKHKKLSPEQKAKAKARAKSHNRRYPNWVDNAWASNH